MNESMEMGLNPEEKPEESEGDELLADYLARHPEAKIPPEKLRESGPEVKEFEDMVDSFESTHSLTDLNSITYLTPEEAPKHPLREPARLALIPIVEKLKILKRETNISPEKLAELQAKYKRLSNAVGFINKNKVDHDR